MTTPTAVLLFAAGLGTRMAPLTDHQPKPMVRVAGKPLIDHALAHCKGLRCVANTHYFADQIRDHLDGTDTLISDETGLLRDTGGGLKHALPLLDSNPVFTMNTDAAWKGENPIHALSAAWRPDTMDALLLLIPRANAVSHSGSGDFDLAAEGRLQRGAAYVYSGVQIIKTDGLEGIAQDAFSMWSLWETMLENGKMFGTVYNGQWCDVGRPESIPVAEQMLGYQRNV